MHYIVHSTVLIYPVSVCDVRELYLLELTRIENNYATNCSGSWLAVQQEAKESRSRRSSPIFGWKIKGKGKEEYLYSAFSHQGTYKAPGMDHTVLPANNTMPAFPSSAFTRCHHHNNWGTRHPIAAYYSFIDPERMKGWVGLVGWPIADGLPT